MTKKIKPFGIIAIIIYASISGLLWLWVGGMLLVAYASPGPEELMMIMGASDSLGFKRFMMAVGGMIYLFIGVLYLSAVYGLFSMIEWGRKLMFWISLVSIPLSIIYFFLLWSGEELTLGNTVLQLVSVLIYSLIVYYLSKSTIKSLFS